MIDLTAYDIDYYDAWFSVTCVRCGRRIRVHQLPISIDAAIQVAEKHESSGHLR